MFNRITIIGTIIIIALMITIPTYNNVKKDHEEKMITATKMEISKAAKDCFLDNKCSGSSTTLGELYEKGYLEKQVNPVTKEYYKDDSVIYYQNKIVVLDFI